MKNFNEWLSFRSNSYQESEGQESDSAFDFRSMPGTVSSTVSRAAGRFKGMLDKYGGAEKIKNNRGQQRIVLADIIKDIYDFSDSTQLSKLKTDLRTLLNHLEVNNNLDVEDDENDENDEINQIDDELDQDK
jgi:hypothetical protein